MPQRVRIRAGECISSIAFEHGFFMETLWDLPENRALRERRGSPFVLEEGDEVFIPDLRPKDVAADTDRRHVFRRRGVPEWLRVRLVDAKNVPRSGLAFRLTILPGIEIGGTTDADGWVVAGIPPNAMQGVLELPGSERYELSLGHLDPADSIRGMQQRLRNLGYLIDADVPGTLGAGTWAAVRRFMLDEADEAVADDPMQLANAQRRLADRHGS